jgi:hypothetical protein
MITYETTYVLLANGNWFTDLRDNVRQTMSRIPGRWDVAEAIAMLEQSRRFHVWPGAYA